MSDSSDDFDSSSEGEMLNMTSLTQILPSLSNGPIKQETERLEPPERVETPLLQQPDMKNLSEQLVSLRREQCRLLVERERAGSQGGCGGPGLEQLEEEVAEARATLERAKSNREQLKLFYARKEKEMNVGPGGEQATMEQYLELKEKYFGLVLEAGELEQELKDIEADLTVSTNGVAKLQRELYKLEGPKENSSPWQVGVPYGSGMAGRF